MRSLSSLASPSPVSRAGVSGAGAGAGRAGGSGSVASSSSPPSASAAELLELREEAAALMQSGLFDSAEVLCSLVLSQIPVNSCAADPISKKSGRLPSSNAAAERAPFLEIMADSLVSRAQHKRASAMFIEAFDALTGRGWLLTQFSMRNDKHHAESAFSSDSVDTKTCARLVFKLAQCLVELRDTTAALRALESIPVQVRPVRVSVLLGKLYLESGSKRQAILCYKSVLSVFPSSTEAMQALVDLGVDQAEISATAGWSSGEQYPEERRSSEPTTRRPVSRLVLNVMPRLTRALDNRARWKIQDAEGDLKKLSSEFPGNSYLLSTLGECMSCRLDAGHPAHREAVMGAYLDARSSDKYMLRNMDSFAAFLSLLGPSKELGVLSNELLSIKFADNASHATGRGALVRASMCQQNASSAEAWVAAAMYSYSKKDFGRALEFIDKAITARNSSSYALGFRLKGLILCGADRLEESVVAFLQSNYISKNIHTYYGLVHAYSRLEKRNEAVLIAKELIVHMPMFADAFVIAGTVLSSSANGTQDAIKCFLRALKIDPMHEDAMGKMATELCKIGKMDEAVQCINQIVQRKPSHLLLTRLSQALRKGGQYYPAIDCLNDALFLLSGTGEESLKQAGDSDAASRQAEIAEEFDALERTLRGEDDAEGDEEEEGGYDAEAAAMDDGEEDVEEYVDDDGFEYHRGHDSVGDDVGIINADDYSY